MLNGHLRSSTEGIRLPTCGMY